MTRWQALAPGPRGALVLGAVALALVALAWEAEAQVAHNPVFVLAVVLAAAALGYLLGAAAAGLWRPPWRGLIVALAAGLLGLALVLVWNQVSGKFDAREWQWLSVLAAGLAALPAVLPAALVRRSGAATAGLALQGLATAAASTVDPVAALLFVPLLALPVELWLVVRRQDGGALTWAVAGALTMGVAVVASRWELWTAAGLWPLLGALASASLSGALFGLLAQVIATALRPRLGLDAAESVADLEGWE